MFNLKGLVLLNFYGGTYCQSQRAAFANLLYLNHFRREAHAVLASVQHGNTTTETVGLASENVVLHCRRCANASLSVNEDYSTQLHSKGTCRSWDQSLKQLADRTLFSGVYLKDYSC